MPCVWKGTSERRSQEWRWRVGGGAEGGAEGGRGAYFLRRPKRPSFELGLSSDQTSKSLRLKPRKLTRGRAWDSRMSSRSSTKCSAAPEARSLVCCLRAAGLQGHRPPASLFTPLASLTYSTMVEEAANMLGVLGGLGCLAKAVYLKYESVKALKLEVRSNQKHTAHLRPLTLRLRVPVPTRTRHRQVHQRDCGGAGEGAPPQGQPAAPRQPDKNAPPRGSRRRARSSTSARPAR